MSTRELALTAVKRYNRCILSQVLGMVRRTSHSSSLTSLNVPLGEEPKPTSTIDKEKNTFPKRGFNVIKIKHKKVLTTKNYKCNPLAKS